MSSVNLIFSSFLALTVVACVGCPAVWAHRDRGPDDPCRREIQASLLHITIYQTQFDPVAEYCEEVPHAGKAFLVVEKGGSVSEAELGEFCRERLAAYKVPKLWEFRDELPKSAMMKLLRRELRAQEIAKNA